MWVGGLLGCGGCEGGEQDQDGSEAIYGAVHTFEIISGIRTGMAIQKLSPQRTQRHTEETIAIIGIRGYWLPTFIAPERK
jgi:hypothetical protein